MADNGHRFNPVILREYDIRGIVGETLTEADATAIGRTLGTLVVRRGGSSVAVGRDGRLSSQAMQDAVVQGLVACGLVVRRIGLGPTPALYFATQTLDVDAGIMVTGSHNPPSHNGFKMNVGRKPFWGPEIQRLGEAALAGDWESGEGRVEDVDIFQDYITALRTGYKFDKGIRVVWDPGNGASGDVVSALTAELPGSHILLNEKIDGTFPAHHPDPSNEANLVQLKAAVAEHHADLGVAFDGDGDRVGVVDAQGRVLWGDQLLSILAAEVLPRHQGASILADVKASQTLFDEIARLGGVPVMCPTGNTVVKSRMVELGAPLAGEMSGHIFYADGWYGFDDGVYVAVRLLDYLARSDRTLAELRDALPEAVNTPEIRMDVPEERKFAIVDEVRDRLAALPGITVSDIDGVRVSNADGWWLLRASNTQNALVVRCEAADEGALERLKQQVRGQLRESGQEPPEL